MQRGGKGNEATGMTTAHQYTHPNTDTHIHTHTWANRRRLRRRQINNLNIAHCAAFAQRRRRSRSCWRGICILKILYLLTKRCILNVAACNTGRGGRRKGKDGTASSLAFVWRRQHFYCQQDAASIHSSWGRTRSSGRTRDQLLDELGCTCRYLHLHVINSQGRARQKEEEEEEQEMWQEVHMPLVVFVFAFVPCLCQLRVASAA